MSPAAELIGAVDIGGTAIAVGIVDASGRVLGEREFPTAPAEGFDAAMGRIADTLRELHARLPAGSPPLAGVGVGCTGPVDAVRGLVLEVDFLPGWNGGDLCAALAGRLDVEVALENDADAFALGEWLFGEGRGSGHLICVTVGTGIGVGVVAEGRLLRGAGGAHPELGHQVIDPTGPPCFCGARGCWEVLARGPAIAQRYNDQAATPADAVAVPLTAEQVCARARQGEELALREVARQSEYLALGVANLVTGFAPNAVVLGGSVMNSADLFLPRIRDRVRSSCRLVPTQALRVVASVLGGRAALLGASVAWARRFRPDLLESSRS